MDIEKVRSRFIKHFDGKTGNIYMSPGRINLIGEHTDYNGGFVFPGAVDKGIMTEIRPNGTGPEPSVPQESQETTYVLNTNTMKFHYPSCSSVDQMKEKNKEIYTGNREDIINMGYMPCKRCNP